MKCHTSKKIEKRAARLRRRLRVKNIINIDQPFDYEEVVSVTGLEYVRNLYHEDIVLIPYEELK